jgi:hypothetical protein
VHGHRGRCRDRCIGRSRGSRDGLDCSRSRSTRTSCRLCYHTLCMWFVKSVHAMLFSWHVVLSLVRVYGLCTSGHRRAVFLTVPCICRSCTTLSALLVLRDNFASRSTCPSQSMRAVMPDPVESLPTQLTQLFPRTIPTGFAPTYAQSNSYTYRYTYHMGIV